MSSSISTDQMEIIEQEERRKLVAFCDKDEEWWKFEIPIDETRCPKCGSLPSKKIGFQVITQRTFRPELHGKKKAKKRR